MTGSRLRVHTTDLVRIDGFHWPAVNGADPNLAIVLAHGLTGSWRRPAITRTAEILRRHGDVLAFDFRGHGRSAGRSTVGNMETLDLDAVVGHARSAGRTRVVTVGFSMGASVVVRHAGLTRGVDAAVSVSGPSRWHYRGTVPMRRAHWVIERRLGRAVARLALRTRIASSRWDPVPASPAEAAGLLAPIPLLVVHGDQDPYFPLDHAYELFAAAAEPKELWIEPGYGHAEAAAGPALVDRIGHWVAAHAYDAGHDRHGADC